MTINEFPNTEYINFWTARTIEYSATSEPISITYDFFYCPLLVWAVFAIMGLWLANRIITELLIRLRKNK